MKYTQYKSLPNKYIIEKIDEFRKEDMPRLDITSETIIETQSIIAHMISEEDCVFSGETIIKHFFPSCKVEVKKNNGDRVLKGEKIASIIGQPKRILSNERIMLNLIQRLCGIATITSQYVNAVQNKVKILDTRKTTPGLRIFEKHAVTCGGGYNHRLDLSSGYLIKDNHLVANQSINEIIENIKKNKNHNPIEVEVDTIKQIKTILPYNVNGFLLDNMNPQTTKKSVEIIKKYNSNIFIESSGGITLTSISHYINTGVDAISIGALTHQAQNINIKLEFA
tara:strand:- start:1070 stop:1912 length:843 start_codon:yes stop_codon:yes gene_type:complete